MLSKDVLNAQNKCKEKTVINNKMETENKFNEIYENIIEFDSKEKKRKRRNSLKEPNIFNKKNKENKISINKKKTKNIEDDINKRFNLISQLKKNEQKNNTNSLSIKNEEKSENNSSLRKNSNNLSFKSYKTITPRNFVLKSEIFKLNKMNNSNNNAIYNDNKDINKINILSEKIKNKEQSNNFYCYLFDKNNDNNSQIESNTYEDKDENEEIQNIFNLNKSLEKNNININININKSITNYYLNNSNKEDSSEDKFSMKNIYQNSINFKNINEEINDDIGENINEFFNNNFPSNNKNINLQKKEKQNDKNNKINKENFVEQKNINNYCNLGNAHTNNNFINKSYFFQNQNKFNMNIPGYYYPFTSSGSPFNYQNNLNLYQYYNNNSNYNSYNYNNMRMNSNIQYINNINQKDSNLINNNINRNNIIDYNSLTPSEIISLIKTQSGCQLLKEKSLNDHKFANEILFPKIKYNLKDICTDFFGNCLIQILLELLTYDNIDAFISNIEESLYDICLTESGSRVIQKLIEKINNQALLLNKFVFNLSNKNIGLLFKSPYGNHILQKYLSIVKKKEFTNFLYNYIYNNFIPLIREKHGVCVLQKSILEADEEQKKKILDLILNNLELIMKDCFGNFLIQYIFNKLDNLKFEDILPIVKKVEENIVDYCKCRFSASVIEKCFERGDPEVSGHIIKNLFDNHLDSIIDLLNNPFGFYVIKKALKIQDENYKRKIIQFILSNKNKLCKTNNGNKIISIIFTEYQKYI